MIGIFGSDSPLVVRDVRMRERAVEIDFSHFFVVHTIFTSPYPLSKTSKFEVH